MPSSLDDLPSLSLRQRRRLPIRMTHLDDLLILKDLLCVCYRTGRMSKPTARVAVLDRVTLKPRGFAEFFIGESVSSCGVARLNNSDSFGVYYTSNFSVVGGTIKKGLHHILQPVRFKDGALHVGEAINLAAVKHLYETLDVYGSLDENGVPVVAMIIHDYPGFYVRNISGLSQFPVTGQPTFTVKNGTPLELVGNIFCCINEDKNMELYDLRTGKSIRKINVCQHDDYHISLAYGNRYLFSSGSEKTEGLHMLDLETGRTRSFPVNTHELEILDVDRDGMVVTVESRERSWTQELTRRVIVTYRLAVPSLTDICKMHLASAETLTSKLPKTSRKRAHSGSDVEARNVLT